MAPGASPSGESLAFEHRVGGMTMRADIGPGVTFPDFELPDHTGRLRRLSEIQGDDPMVIVLDREAYSAKDPVQHEGLVVLGREMKPGVGYRRMVTITTAEPQEALNYRNGVGRSGRSWLTRAGSCSATWTSPSTRTRRMTRWSRTRSCASPG
jgi:hypothetical protein